MTKIVGFETNDIRFPTSANLDGSDAMNPSPDYSAASLVVRTDGPDSLAGHAHVFTIGRGNDIQLSAVRALQPLLAGRDVDEVLADLGGLSRELVGDSPLRWLGQPGWPAAAMPRRRPQVRRRRYGRSRPPSSPSRPGPHGSPAARPHHRPGAAAGLGHQSASAIGQQRCYGRGDAAWLSPGALRWKRR